MADDTGPDEVDTDDHDVDDELEDAEADLDEEIDDDDLDAPDTDDEGDDGLEPIALIARVALVALLLTGIGAAAFVLLSDDDDGNRTQFASSPIEDTDETSAETSEDAGSTTDDGDSTSSAESDATDADEAEADATGDDTAPDADADADADGTDTATGSTDVDDAASAAETADRDTDSGATDDAAEGDDAVTSEAVTTDDAAAGDDATTDDADTATGDDAGSTEDDTADAGASGSSGVPAAVDTDSPRPTTAEVSFETLPDGQPVPVLAMFDDDRIVLEGTVPSEEAAAFLRDLALINSQFPDIPIEDRLVINPEVPATVGVRVLELNSPRFPTSSSDVTPEHAAQLDRLVPVLRALPNVHTLVVGHADQRGDPAANYVLSTDRAQSVVDYLVFKGVEPERLSARAVGENDLLSMAEDLDALALNRRTEFILTGLLLGM